MSQEGGEMGVSEGRDQETWVCLRREGQGDVGVSEEEGPGDVGVSEEGGAERCGCV